MATRTAKNAPIKFKVPDSMKQYAVGKDAPKSVQRNRGDSNSGGGNSGGGQSNSGAKTTGANYPYEFLKDMRKAEIKERNPDTGNDILLTSLDPYENPKHKEIVDSWYERWQKKNGGGDGSGAEKSDEAGGSGAEKSKGKKRRVVKKRSEGSLPRGKSLGTASSFAHGATVKALGFDDAEAYANAAKEAKEIKLSDLKEAVKGEGKQWVQFVGFLGEMGLKAAKSLTKVERKKKKSKKPKSAKDTLDASRQKMEHHKKTVDKKRATLSVVSDVLMKYTDVAVGVAATAAFGPLGGVVGAFVTNAVGRLAKDKVQKIDELMGVNCSEITDLQKKNCFKKAGLNTEDEQLEGEIMALVLKIYVAYGQAVKEAFEELKNMSEDEIKQLEETYKFSKLVEKATKAPKKTKKTASDFYSEVMGAFNEACDLEDDL